MPQRPQQPRKEDNRGCNFNRVKFNKVENPVEIAARTALHTPSFVGPLGEGRQAIVVDFTVGSNELSEPVIITIVEYL